MKRLTLRIPDDLHRRLHASSRASHSSLNDTILTMIRRGLTASEEGPADETPRERERRRVHEALASFSSRSDTNSLFPWVPPLPPDFDWEAFRRSLPVLDPPLSQTIIQEREESRY